MIVNAEYDKGFMPPPLHPLLSSGHTFSARRWLSSLQRRCEFLAQRLSPAFGISRAGESRNPITTPSTHMHPVQMVMHAILKHLQRVVP